MQKSNQNLPADTPATNTAAFTSQNEVQECLRRLQSTFHGQNPLVVSDVLDEHGNQYVNLVQKGGGVLGVALVGYTYVLEQMGIRFMRLAGTSAGAINTALMTAVGKKEEAKSERIVDIMCNLDFFSLVDGHPAARWLIKNVITHKNFTSKLTNKLRFGALAIVLLFVLDFVLLGLEQQNENLAPYTQVSFVLTGFALLLVGTLLFYLQRLTVRLKKSGFGVNPGDFFYDWIKEQFKNNGVNNVTDLVSKAAQPVPGLKLRVEHAEGTEGLKGDVTFITSELVSENKIQFPKMCNLFREKDKIDTLQPAGFVRASMAIPIFFESYFINNIPVASEDVKLAWKQTFGNDTPPPSARFVDGGLLSNFPINLFFNPNIDVPRLPTFAIDLDDSNGEDKEPDADMWSLGGYFGRMLTTLRGFYDKDFLVQNQAYKRGIGKVRLPDFNWLNFFLTDDDKKKMFRIGAEAATEFLLNFDWEAYKTEQTSMRREYKSKR